jgi:uncharacterized protein involved in type VI secretion and phage assembly
MANDFTGVLIGVVTDRDDPQQEGRIQVRFPTFPDSLGSFWAPIANPMAGGDRGFRFSPEIGDECLVSFDRGHPDHPFIVGFTHNGADKPPTTDPQERVIASVNGHQIVFHDPDPAQGDKGRLLVRDAHGSAIEMTNGHVAVHVLGHLDIRADVLTLNGRPVNPGTGTV